LRLCLVPLYLQTKQFLVQFLNLKVFDKKKLNFIKKHVY
jgi:hypothetical protein